MCRDCHMSCSLILIYALTDNRLGGQVCTVVVVSKACFDWVKQLGYRLLEPILLAEHSVIRAMSNIVQTSNVIEFCWIYQ